MGTREEWERGHMTGVSQGTHPAPPRVHHTTRQYVRGMTGCAGRLEKVLWALNGPQFKLKWHLLLL